MIDIGKKISILLIITAVISLVSYLFNIIVIRNYSNAEYGLLSKAVIFSSVLNLFIAYETNALAQKMYVSNEFTEKQIIAQIHGLRILNAIIGTIAILIYFDFKIDLFVVTVFALSISVFNISYVFEANDKNKIFLIILLFEKVFYFCFACVMLKMGWQLLMVVSVSLLVSAPISLIIQFKVSKLEYDRSFQFLNIVKIYKINLKFLFNAFALFIFGNVSKLLLEGKIGLDGLGVFNFCWQVVSVATIINGVLQRSVRNKIHFLIEKKRNNELKTIIGNIYAGSVVIFILANIILYIFGEHILILIKRDGSREFIILMHIFTIYFIVAPMDVVNEIFSIHGNLNVGVAINLVAGLTLIFLIYIMESKSLMFYAILLTSFQFLTSLIIQYISIRKYKNNQN